MICCPSESLRMLHWPTSQLYLVINMSQNLQLQVEGETLTPSLRKEIMNVIKVHEEALKRPSLDVSFIKELDSLQDQIEEHWTKVYKSCIDRSFIVADMGQHQLFLTALLLAEYTGVSFIDNESIEWLQLSATNIHKMATDDNVDPEAVRHESIGFTLEELLLNRPHVEERILLAAAEHEQRRPLGRYVQRLTDQRDWKNLAKFLYHDRELALNLFEYQPIAPGLFDSRTRDRVLQGIKSIQDRFFTNISSPTKYTASKYAMDLETAKDTPDAAYQTKAPLSEADEGRRYLRGSPFPRNYAKSISNAIADGIKSLGTHSGLKQPRGDPASANVISEENTPLVDEKKI